MRFIIVLLLASLMAGCVSGKKKKEKDQTNQATVFEISCSAVYDMMKAFRKCFHGTDLETPNYIILFKVDIHLTDESAMLNAFEMQTVHPEETIVANCTEDAKKIGESRLQKEWQGAKGIYKIGDHRVISYGEVIPKGRYNTTDLNTGVTEVGY